MTITLVREEVDLAEWLTPESLEDIAEMLILCEDAEVLAELRRLIPREALREASRQIPPEVRERIKLWLEQLNSQSSKMR